MKKLLTISLMLFCFISADEFFEPKTSIGGYGEMHWDMESESTNLDFHRFIVYFKHQFSPEWSMMSEVEIEHNMVGSEASLGYGSGNTYNSKYKGGYVAMEQAHLNYWNGKWGFQGGVLLIPSGIINEFHEPPTFMSVERPEYNSKIIPTTWFDNGFAFYGAMGDFNWKVAMTGDMDGDKIADGIRSARRKGHYSRTDSWTKTFQGSWTGMEGLKIGGSMTMNDAPATALGDSNDCGADGASACNDIITREAVSFNLTEFNATYSANNFYARMEYGTIGYENNLHQVKEANDAGTPDDIADDYFDGAINEIESSSGYYLDLGYDIASLVGCGDDSNLYLWTRMSAYNTDDVGDDTEISLFGVTYKPINNISFKLEMGTKDDADVMRMGIGYMF